MLRLVPKFVSTVIASLLIVGVSSALMPQVPLKQKCAGTLTTVVPGHLSYTGAGQANHFGNYAIVGSTDFDQLGNLLNGHDFVIAADGSTIEGSYSGTFTPLPTGQIRFNVTVVWSNGTGRFAGVTGQSDVVAFADGVAPGAAFHYEALGNLIFP
jgi:hypothetical protein